MKASQKASTKKKIEKIIEVLSRLSPEDHIRVIENGERIGKFLKEQVT
jgi:hypothetical protein